LDTLNQILFLGICFVILFRFYRLTLHNRPWSGLLSALACVLYIICLYGSALMQVAGLSSTKLLGPHILPPAQAYELGGLASNWALELCVILLGEMIAGVLVSSHKLVAPAFFVSTNALKFNFITRNAALVLIIVGSLSTIAFHSDLSSRADGGQGLVTILKTCLAVGLCALAFNNFFNQRIYYCVGACGMIFLVMGAVRSPLLSVALAFFAGKIARREITTATLMRYAVYGLVLAIIGGAMSNFRGDIVSGRGADLYTALSESIENPFIAIYGGGIDTLDGYRLAQFVQPNEAASPENVLVAITTFVPRALWPNKPQDLSIDITNRYLQWNQGGIFLSLVGYLSIAFGGYIEALFALLMLMVGLCAIYRRSFVNFYGFTILLMTFRLFLGGSPFDIYYCLVYMLIYTLAKAPFMLMWAGSRKTSAVGWRT
jgi:hypothetical protein